MSSEGPGWFQQLAAAPAPQRPAVGGRERWILGLVAAAVGGWILAFKLKAYFGLATTSDMYVVAQLATTWLDGHYLQDNYFGNQLATHAFLSAPALAIFVVPFGPAGLFVALALGAALGLAGLHRLLRALQVPPGASLAFAALGTLMPLTMHTYQDVVYGFHIELMEPALAAWLAYFLVVRHGPGALLTALALLSVKEDAVLIVIPVALMVASEDLVRALTAGARRGVAWLNRPALATVALAIVAVPLLLLLLKSQQVPDAPTNLGRVRAFGTDGIHSNQELVRQLLGNLVSWLQSPVVAKWGALALGGTFGLVLLRPHFLVFGVVTTLTSWLVQDELLWEPRFVQALAFYQVAACLAFASVWRLGTENRGPWVRRLAAAGLVAGVVGGLWQQTRAVPGVAGIYRLSPQLTVEPALRARADRLYAAYRGARRPGEAVLAPGWLTRYADYRSLLWPSRLPGRPKPVWILWDTASHPLNELWQILRTDARTDLLDYRLVAEDGRFLLYRRRADTELAAERAAGWPRIEGEEYGVVRLKIQLPEGRGGLVEPLLSIGSAGRGDLFFIRYLSDRQLVLGVERIGNQVEFSAPIDFEPDRDYALELFTGSLLPPPGKEPAVDRPAEWRLRYQDLVSARWNGREVIRRLAPPRPVRPEDVTIGGNAVRAGSVVAAKFTGKVLEATRGGYPALAEGPGAGAEFGAIRFTLQLPSQALGVPEPLLVAGMPGNATLGYIRMLPGNQVRLGAEFWGFAALESDPQAVAAGQPVEVVFHLPVLYPAPGDDRWGRIPRAEQERLRATLRISLNGRVVLAKPVPAPVPRLPTPTFGRNPVGGSWVSPAFTGEILQVARVWPGEPAAGDAQP